MKSGYACRGSGKETHTFAKTSPMISTGSRIVLLIFRHRRIMIMWQAGVCVGVIAQSLLPTLGRCLQIMRGLAQTDRLPQQNKQGNQESERNCIRPGDHVRSFISHNSLSHNQFLTRRRTLNKKRAADVRGPLVLTRVYFERAPFTTATASSRVFPWKLAATGSCSSRPSKVLP